MIFSSTAVAALYVAAAKLGFWLSGGTFSNITPVWPPSGIAVAAVLLLGSRFAPAIFAGAFIANLVWTPAGVLTSFGIGVGNMLEALCAGVLVRRFDRDPLLETVRSVLIFILFASIVAPSVSAVCGVICSLAGGVLTQDLALSALVTWWLGDCGGVLVVAPLCVACARRPWRELDAVALAELFVLLCSACGLCLFTFARGFPAFFGDYALTYVLFPFLIWAAVRFELWGASATTFCAACVAIWGTMRGSGPYAGGGLGMSLTLLIAFVGVAAVTSLILAAALLERRRTAAALRRLNAELENRVFERTDALNASQEKLRRSERLASIGTLASGIAHEINNPAASILSTAQLALERLGEANGVDAARRSFVHIVDEAKRCGWIVKNLLQFARTQRLEKAPVNLNDIVTRSVKATAEYAAKFGAHVQIQLDSSLGSSMLCATAIEQVLINLIRNAVEAGQSGTNILVQTFRDPDVVRLVVADNGPGVSEEMKRRILDPFYTTRVGAGGTGLGLSICHGIVAQHDGTIEIESEVGLGTKVIIVLPAGETSFADQGRM